MELTKTEFEKQFQKLNKTYEMRNPKKSISSLKKIRG